MISKFRATMKSFNTGIPEIIAFTSTAGTGGAATEVMSLAGLLATDAIVSVTQKTKGGTNLPLLGYTIQANNALTCVWSATPGAGTVVVVLVKR